MRMSAQCAACWGGGRNTQRSNLSFIWRDREVEDRTQTDDRFDTASFAHSTMYKDFSDVDDDESKLLDPGRVVPT